MRCKKVTRMAMVILAKGGVWERRSASQPRMCGITVQLLEPGDLRMMGRQITEEVAEGSLVEPSGSIAERSGERLRRTCKQ